MHNTSFDRKFFYCRFIRCREAPKIRIPKAVLSTHHRDVDACLHTQRCGGRAKKESSVPNKKKKVGGSQKNRYLHSTPLYFVPVRPSVRFALPSVRPSDVAEKLGSNVSCRHSTVIQSTSFSTNKIPHFNWTFHTTKQAGVFSTCFPLDMREEVNKKGSSCELQLISD